MLSTSIIASILVVVSETFWISSGAAQLRKVVKTRDMRGLSAVTITLYAAGNIAWMTYFATLDLWLAFAGDSILFCLTVVLLGYVLGNKRQFYRGVITIIIVGPLGGAALVYWPLNSGWFGMGFNLIAVLPQLYRVIRVKKVSGISIHGLTYALAAIACTMTYGILVHAHVLTLACLQGTVIEGIFVYYYLRYHRK